MSIKIFSKNIVVAILFSVSSSPGSAYARRVVSIPQSAEQIMIDGVLSYEHAQTISQIKKLCAVHSQLQTIEIQPLLDRLVKEGKVLKIELPADSRHGVRYLYLKFRGKIVSDKFTQAVQRLLINDQGQYIGRYVVPEITPADFYSHLEELKEELKNTYISKLGREGLDEFSSEGFYQAFKIIGDSLADIRKALMSSIQLAQQRIATGENFSAQLADFWSPPVESDLLPYGELLEARRRKSIDTEKRLLQQVTASITTTDPDRGPLAWTNEHLSFFSSKSETPLEVLGVLLLGCWARGRPNEGTDMDFIVITNNSENSALAGEIFTRAMYDLVRFGVSEVDVVDYLAMDDLGKWRQYFSSHAQFVGWQPYIILTLSPENLKLIEETIAGF